MNFLKDIIKVYHIKLIIHIYQGHKKKIRKYIYIYKGVNIGCLGVVGFVYMCVCCSNCVSFCSSVFSNLCTTNTYGLHNKHDNKEKINSISMGNSPQH